MAQFTTEDQFLRAVTQALRLANWRYFHPWISLHSVGGFPDITAISPGTSGRPSRVVFIELKTERGKLSASQEAWGEALQACPGVEYYVFKPSQWDEFLRMIQGGDE